MYLKLYTYIYKINNKIFYQKLPKLKDTMKTSTDRGLDLEKHKVMIDFLNQFHDEWNGVK